MDEFGEIAPAVRIRVTELGVGAQLELQRIFHPVSIAVFKAEVLGIGQAGGLRRAGVCKKEEQA